MKMMLMVITMMNKILHLLRPCSWGTLDEATLQHGSPTVHNLYVLQMIDPDHHDDDYHHHS